MVKRFMIPWNSLSGAKAAYYFLQAITNPSVLNSITINDRRPLLNSLVRYSLNDNQGIIQHKYTVAKHAIVERFPGQPIYEEFQRVTGIPHVTCQEVSTDLRVLPELPVVATIHSHFGKDILHTHANLDSNKTNNNTFAGQQQTNYDFSHKVTTLVKHLWENVPVITHKTLLQDEKSGTGMFQHSTSGSLGILYYDMRGENIQMMSHKYSLEALIEHDKRNLASIKQALIHDYKYDYFINTLTEAQNILKNEKNIPLDYLHNQYQQFIWDNLQRHPMYNRNLSFIFCKTINTDVIEDNFEHFRVEFLKRLRDKIYNLDKRGDMREIFIATVFAYRDTVDKNIVDKLKYLKYDQKIEFSSKFFEDITIFLKKNAFYT